MSSSGLLKTVDKRSKKFIHLILFPVSVECEGTDMMVTYKPRGVFRGRVYVPGRGDNCSARGTGAQVRLALPLHGDCDVNFAYGISNGPNGIINR